MAETNRNAPLLIQNCRYFRPVISQETVQRIINSINVLEVVGDFVQLKRRGANYLGLCPFHGEKTPSFTVSPSKEIYKCFGLSLIHI